MVLYPLAGLALASLLAAACFAGPPPIESDSDTSASEEPELVDDDLLLEYHRSGGLVGFNDRLVIYADGRITLTTRGALVSESSLEPAALGELLAVLADSDFCALPSPDAPAPRGTDRITYTVVDHACDPPHSVTVVDGAITDSLAVVLAALDTIMRGMPR